MWYVSGAVKCNKLLGKSFAELEEEEEEEETAKLWLRYACDRSGGHNNRRSSKAQTQPTTVVQQQTDTDSVWHLWHFTVCFCFSQYGVLVCNFDLLFYVLYDVRCRMHVDVRCPPTGMVNRVRLYGLLWWLFSGTCAVCMTVNSNAWPRTPADWGDLATTAVCGRTMPAHVVLPSRRSRWHTPSSGSGFWRQRQPLKSSVGSAVCARGLLFTYVVVSFVAVTGWPYWRHRIRLLVTVVVRQLASWTVVTAVSAMFLPGCRLWRPPAMYLFHGLWWWKVNWEVTGWRRTLLKQHRCKCLLVVTGVFFC